MDASSQQVPIWKRSLDLVVGSLCLFLTAPLLLVIALCVRFTLGRPILFRQLRPGLGGHIFVIHKFRSMRTADDSDNRGDEYRITRFGAFLRKTSLDELPQLFNVLFGNMSIVGPRPHATAHNEIFEGQISPFRRRHNVKPGITGWAQVNGYRGQTDTLEKMRRRVECDLYYIDHWSLLFDVKIVIMTLFSKRTYTNAY